MKVAIIGAGALGGTFGFLLADAGHDVTLIDVDQAKIEAIRRDGITLIMPDGTRRHRPMSITSEPQSVGISGPGAGLSEGVSHGSAAQSAQPMIGPNTYVLSLQNGLTNLQRIAEVVGAEKVLGGVTAHSAMPLDHTSDQVQRGHGRVSISVATTAHGIPASRGTSICSSRRASRRV